MGVLQPGPRKEKETVEFRLNRSQLRARFDQGRLPAIDYAVVALELLALWILATSTGGYIQSPLGLVFTSAVLFGQIRGNKRQDIYILFWTALIGASSSDLIVHRGWLPKLFPSAHEISIAPWTWYIAIASTMAVSTVVNLATAKWVSHTASSPAAS